MDWRQCETCAYARRNEYGVFQNNCDGYGNCSYDKYVGTVGKLLNNEELHNLYLGSIVRVEWNNGKEKYEGVIFGNSIGYEDNKTDTIDVIAEHMSRELCKVYLLEL